MWMGGSKQILIYSATRAHSAEIKLGVRASGEIWLGEVSG